MKTYLIIITLIINVISCSSSKNILKNDSKLSPEIVNQWNKYLNNVEKIIKVTDNKKTLLKIKSNMMELYIEGIEQYSNFPDDISIKISRLSEKIDKKIHTKILKKNSRFKSVDIVANKINKQKILGALDDGTTVTFTEKDLKSSFYWPLKNIHINSAYGFRADPFEKDKIKFHHGVDLAGNLGDYVMASNYGKVVFTGKNGGYGLMVMIAHANNILTIYGHLSKILVKKGQFVKRAEVIAEIGSTGKSTGPHLHFEIRKNNRSIDPIFFIESQGIQ